MVANRKRDTKPELALRSAVHRLGLRYRVAIRPAADVPRLADLVFARARVAVFLDGCYWHRCPDHFRYPLRNADYWKWKIDGNVLRDADTDKRLVAAGWTAIRIWEHESPTSAAERVAAIVRAPR
jgi:DNA mismatch endonuclease (patch repair protein)